MISASDSFSSDILIVANTESLAQPDGIGNGNGNKENGKDRDDDKKSENNQQEALLCNPEMISNLTFNSTRLVFVVGNEFLETAIDDLGEVSIDDLAKGLKFVPSVDFSSDTGVLELEETGHTLLHDELGELELLSPDSERPQIKIQLQNLKDFKAGQEYVIQLDLNINNDLKNTNKGCLLDATLFEL